jgi:hypothetical protein
MWLAYESVESAPLSFLVECHEHLGWVLPRALATPRLDFLEWMHASGNGWVENDVQRLASECGTIDAIAWLREHGLEWDQSMSRQAAAGNSLQVLQYMVQNGCPVASEVEELVTVRGDVEALIWLMQRGLAQGLMHHNHQALWNMITFNQVEMLDFLLDHAEAWTDQVLWQYMVQQGSQSLIQLAIKRTSFTNAEFMHWAEEFIHAGNDPAGREILMRMGFDEQESREIMGVMQYHGIHEFSLQQAIDTLFPSLSPRPDSL